MNKIRNAAFISVLLLLAANSAWAAVQTDCPFGLVDDPAPGSCGRYLDANGDQLCDYSQTADELARAAAGNSQTALNNGAAARQAAPATKSSIGNALSSRYPLIPVLAFGTALYLLSYYASKARYISVLVHRRIWNVLLLVFFLLSAFSGLFLVLHINYRLNISWPFNLLYWHVETGIVMAAISVYHILWHIPYFKCIFITTKKSGVEKCDDKSTKF